MTKRVPLSTLLGQFVVAHTIEVDGLFEQRMPHSTSLARGAGRPNPDPWLVSYVMWSNFLRHVGPDGITVAELQRHAAVTKPALQSRLNGLTRWRYVTVQASASTRSTQDALVRLTRGGVQACETFAPLPAEVEQR